MEFRKLGHSGIDVSAFSLGSWLTYEYMEEQEALAVINRGLEAGINFFDDARYDDKSGTAPLKSGYSEVVFGRLIRQTGRSRAGLVIANKLWYEFYPDESPEQELDGSLARLQMDYIDLLYCNPPPASIPMAEVVQQMDDLIKAGKIKTWGVVNWTTDKIEEAYQAATTAGLSLPCAAQLRYSVLETSPVEDEPTQNLFGAAGIGVVASYSLYGGLLTGKYNQTDGAIEGRFGADAVASMRERGLLAKVERIISLAQELVCSPAQLALAYCLKNDQVSSILFGASKVAQVEDNIQALAILPQIDQAVMAKLRDA
ncbi:MAG TPA: aldo/keto reductase [Anaerolineae bacterium]|jgi:aryl-alcohol dehydrogenase-like predicted oxidoreductase